MLCDKCKKHEACYHSTLVVNGEARSTHLCEECAITEGVFSTPRTSIFDEFRSLTNFLGFDDFVDKACPNCNWTLSKFKSFGKLGCGECYNAFEDEVGDIIKRIQPYTSHNAENIEFNVQKESVEMSKRQRLVSLKSDLQKAIKEERYEDAGLINKEIKQLEKEFDSE